MFRAKRLVKLLFILVMMIVSVSLVINYARARGASSFSLSGDGGDGLRETAKTDDVPYPLPHDCDGVAPDGWSACCVFGYVYFDDAPVAGASVRIQSSRGIIITTTASGGASSEPYFSADLSAAPLRASPGDSITIEASHGDMVSTRTWTVQKGAQQVDVGLIADVSGLNENTLAQTVVQPANVRQVTGGEVPFGPASTIADDLVGAMSVYAVDVDGDGDRDVLSASRVDDKIVWYENNGGVEASLTFTAHLITNQATDAVAVYAVDMDGDGDVDVLSSYGTESRIAWHENDGDVGGPPSFTTHLIADSLRTYGIYAADVDGDGDTDIVSGSRDNEVAWYENDGGVSFTRHVIISTTYGAGAVYATDLDGDGDVDILSASWDDDKIAWYENDGGSPPTFDQHVITTNADYATSVYAADVDRDGDVDVLSASADDDTLAWYENDGGSPPTFAEHGVTTGADGASSVYAADVDGDGDLDVLSASAHDDTIAWYENPTWSEHVVTTGADGASSVYAVDVDGDGDVDVLSASEQDGKIVWYPNQTIHHSAFYPEQSLVADGAARGARSVYAADVDGDGDQDILAASGGDDKIAWYENTGGLLPAYIHHVITTDANGARSVYAADVDGDGDIDVLSASRWDDTVAWYENDGGSSPAFTKHVIATDADDAVAVHAADLDADGDVDVISASRNDNTIAWYENDGSPSPTFTSHIITNSLLGPWSVYAEDVDEDGDIDILSVSGIDSHDYDLVAWFENSGGSVPTFTFHVITTDARWPDGIYAKDLDGDEKIDVLSASWADNRIAWYKNDGNSPPSFTPYTITTNARGAWSVYAVDVDKDGNMDVLSASEADDKIAWYESNGGIGATLTFTEHVITTNTDGAYSVYAEDMNGDGDVDVLSASARDDTIAWYENDGTSPAFFSQHVIAPVADGARSVYVADVDQDGDPDILSASGYDDRITWYENSGGTFPAFVSHAITTTADEAYSVYASDVDSDGDVDVLSASYRDDTIAWYENDGSSSPVFTSHVITDSADGAQAVHAADVDGDGDVDVLSASLVDDTIAWYESDGGSPPAFTSHVITSSAEGAFSVYAADVDRDGDLDVLSASRDDDTIAWYENDGSSPPVFISHVITTTADGATSVHAADVDRDGDLDVLTTSWHDDTIAWYENPSWSKHTIANNADGATSVYASDADSDGDIDVFAASARNNRITWYENDGAAIPSFTPHVITTDAFWAWAVYAADVDGDGRVDALSASTNDDKIAWYKNRGGHFALDTGDRAPFTIMPTQRDDLLHIVATHRGRAGDADVELVTLELLFEDITGAPLTTVQANALIESLYIYRDDGSGGFETMSDTLVTTIETLSLATGTQTVAFADGDPNVQVAFDAPISLFVVVELTEGAIDQMPYQFRVRHVTDPATGAGAISSGEDRDRDLPLESEYAANVASSLCSAPTIYSESRAIPFGTGADRTFATDVGDADNDGYLDIAVGNHGYNQVCWGHSDGTYSCENAFGGSATFDVEWGDLNGDGFLDLAVTNSMGHANLACLNNQDHSFTCTPFSLCAGPGANEVCFVALGDVGEDENGDVDIALGTRYPGNVLEPDVIYYNKGDGTFPITDTVNTCQGHPTIELAFGDADGDEDLDLAVVGHYSEFICINDGSGHFTETRWLVNRLDKNTQSVAWGDADGDGDLDLAVGRESYSNEVYLNDGHGYFPSKLSFGPVWERTWDVAWGDVDGDGDLDLATGNTYMQTVVYFNELMPDTGRRAFVQSGALRTGTNRIDSIAFADVNGDGELDLAAGSNGNQNVVYQNMVPLIAVFTASPLSGIAPFNVQFMDQSIGDVVAWTWDLGDGNISGARHPSHIYENTGVYTVSLTVSGPDGVDTETKLDYITAGSLPPIADISFIWYPSYPAPAVQGRDVIFFNGTARDADERGAYISKYTWTSSIDGQLSSHEDFVLRASQLSTGTHVIAFQVQDDESEWSPEVTRTLTVTSPQADVRTLILVNRQKLTALYSASEADLVMRKLDALAAHDSVKGLVVQVENDPAVAATYAAWDTELTSTVKANAVAGAVKALIDEQWAIHPDLEYLVIVGDDRAIPFRRVPDQTRFSERHYGFVSASSTIGAALRDDMTLTDDYYADAAPTVPRGRGWDGHELYIPDLGSGRLIETPDEIMAQIDAFLLDDEVTASDATITGYGIVEDGAQTICNRLNGDGLNTDCSLIGGGWGRDEFISKTLDIRHDIVSINGHANHFVLSTPLGRPWNSERIFSNDVANAPADHARAVFYVIGCHAGLNVPPTNLYGALDLAQALAQQRANYLASTGYDWAYFGSVGLSEQLMLDFTERLVYGRSATLGQALVSAKQEYYLSEGRFDHYDEKILIASTLYGLPMYRYNTPAGGGMRLQDLGQDHGPGVMVAKQEQKTALANGLVVKRLTYQFPTPPVTETDDGQYYAFSNLIHASEGEPIQPKYVADVSLPLTRAHGAAFTGGTYVNVPSFDPVIERAITETTSLAEPDFSAPGWYPSLLHGLNRLEWSDRLVFLLGQFNARSKTERVYDRVSFDVYYHTSSDDWTAPTIESVRSHLGEITATVTVTASDASGIETVIVAYTDGKGTWTSTNLTEKADTWEGTFFARIGTEFHVQVVDKAGNVATQSRQFTAIYLPLTVRNY